MLTVTKNISNIASKYIYTHTLVANPCTVKLLKMRSRETFVSFSSYVKHFFSFSL